MLSIANTNSTATCEASSHSKDYESRLQAGVRFNLSSAKILLFLEEKENKSTKRTFFQNLCNKYLFCSKKIFNFALNPT